MTLEITEDLIARQPPEARAIIRLLLVKIAELETRLNKRRKTPPCRPAHSIRTPNRRRRSRNRSENEAGNQDMQSMNGR